MSDSYARGGQPRSVPDPDREAYDEMVRKQRALNAKQDADYWSSHPGLAESLIPVWGSAREAIADAHEGDVLGAVGNSLLAVTDLAPGAALVKTAGKGIVKGGLKMGGSHTWGASRKWMGRRGLIDKGMEAHHAIIPRGGPGKLVPDIIKNQPWNITALPRETHRRIHTKFNGQPRFAGAQRFATGTPTWGRSVIEFIPARVATATDASLE